jgi:hypothetical protein
MKNRIDEILDKLIEEMRKGRSVDDCLREYGEYAGELRPLLELCEQISTLPRPEPDSDKVAATTSKARAIWVERGHRKWLALRDMITFRPILVRVLAIIVIVLLATMTTVTLSANSLPGDTLYSVKLLTERVRYLLTFDAEGKARLHLMFADRRTNEFSCLCALGIPVDKELLSSMLSETDQAIGQIELLSVEHAARFVEQVDKCNQIQLTVLEDTRTHVHGHDREIVEQAIQTCIQQHECIECMKNSDSTDETDCRDGRPRLIGYNI